VEILQEGKALLFPWGLRRKGKSNHTEGGEGKGDCGGAITDHLYALKKAR